MPVQLGAEYWRKRAEEARAEAGKVGHATAKRTLLSIAENYDELARQAEAMAAAKGPPIQR